MKCLNQILAAAMKRRQKHRSVPQKTTKHRNARPTLERLEDRLAPAIFNVASAADLSADCARGKARPQEY
jgi:hypothetical protein